MKHKIYRKLASLLFVLLIITAACTAEEENPSQTEAELANDIIVQKEVNEEWWKAFRYLFAESYPDPTIEDPRFQFKEQMNVLVILDVSGSMANTIDGKTLMNFAKDWRY